MKKSGFSLSDGRYVDWWSLVHVGSGIVLGLIFIWIGFDFVYALLAIFVLNVLWEIVEPTIYFLVNSALKNNRTKFRETTANQIIDIIFDVIGFLLIWWVVKGF